MTNSWCRYLLYHEPRKHGGELPELHIHFHARTPSHAIHVATDLAERLRAILEFQDQAQGTALRIIPHDLAMLPNSYQTAPDQIEPPADRAHYPFYPNRKKSRPEGENNENAQRNHRKHPL